MALQCKSTTYSKMRKVFLPSYIYDLLKMLEGLLREMRKIAHSQ